MSLLIFKISPEQVVVVTDTLATDGTGRPFFFTTKCMIVPHLNLAIAGTGVGQLGVRWTAHVTERIASRDVVMLNEHAPAAIAATWENLRHENGPSDNTSTIYHFGLSEGAREYVGFAYRSTNDFASERLPSECFAVKPGPTFEFAASNDLQDWIKLARAVRAEQDQLPHEERVYVGGALTAIFMQNGSILAQEIFRFDDFEEMWLDLNDRLE